MSGTSRANIISIMSILNDYSFTTIMHAKLCLLLISHLWIFWTTIFHLTLGRNLDWNFEISTISINLWREVSKDKFSKYHIRSTFQIWGQNQKLFFSFLSPHFPLFFFPFHFFLSWWIWWIHFRRNRGWKCLKEI